MDANRVFALLLSIYALGVFAAAGGSRVPYFWPARAVRTRHPYAGVQEKSERSKAQKKIDSQLLFTIYRSRGEIRKVPAGESGVKPDEKGRAAVSIRAKVSRALLDRIRSLGGEIISSSIEYNDIRANVPLGKLETLAARRDVIAIIPAEEAITN